METIINAWGGEGLLSSAAIFALGAMGLFNDFANEKIHVRVLDLAGRSGDADRMNQLEAAYSKYFSIVYGTEPTIVFDSISIDDIVRNDNSSSVIERYKDMDALALGCSVSDMKLNIRNGIYGKPWLGEIYYSDSDFSKLYEDIPRNSEIVIINCGGYRGGGTATTFIPLENMYSPPTLITHRFIVAAGPSTKFVFKVKMPHPEIYKMADLAEVDIFDIPDVVRKIGGLNINSEKNKENVNFLINEYKKVYSYKYDYRNLDPKYYSSRFLDRIISDVSKTEAVFINIKTDGEKILPFDVTSNSLELDKQYHKMHISSFLNALSVREIVFNHEKYYGGKVYAFGTNAGDHFEPDTLFDNNERAKFWQFIVMSALMVFFVHDSFAFPFDDGFIRITEKWGKRKNSVINQFFGVLRIKNDTPVAVNENDKAGAENRIFANKILDILETYIEEFIKPVLKAINEIDETSDQTLILKDNVKGIVMSILSFSADNDWYSGDEMSPESFISAEITKIESEMACLSGKDINILKADAESMVRKFISDFPKCANDTEVMDYIGYSERIIRYTMERSAAFIGGEII